MADSFQDTKPTAPSQQPAYMKPATEETIREGDHPRGIGYGREDIIKDRGAQIDRVLSEGVLGKIAAIEKREAPKEVTETTAPETTEAPATAATEAKPAPVPVPVPDEWRTKYEEAQSRAASLEAELAAAKKAPAPVTPPKMLQDAYDAYATDSVSALRRFVAGSLGVEDPSDPKVDNEIKDLYTDLTAAVLGAKTDDSHQAKRDAARALLLMARENRERKAEEAKAAEKAKAEAEAGKAAEAARFIGSRMASKSAEGKSLGEEFPLLQQFSERLDGMKPEALIWEVLQRESKAGRIASTLDDDAKIRAAAKLVETHYQDLADRIGKAKPSTAQPTPPQPTRSSNDTRQETPARTLTTADASVAPAKPPAPEAIKDNKPPSFKNAKAHAEWALRRLPKGY